MATKDKYSGDHTISVSDTLFVDGKLDATSICIDGVEITAGGGDNGGTGPVEIEAILDCANTALSLDSQSVGFPPQLNEVIGATELASYMTIPISFANDFIGSTFHAYDYTEGSSIELKANATAESWVIPLKFLHSGIKNILKLQATLRFTHQGGSQSLAVDLYKISKTTGARSIVLTGATVPTNGTNDVQLAGIPGSQAGQDGIVIDLSANYYVALFTFIGSGENVPNDCILYNLKYSYHWATLC